MRYKGFKNYPTWNVALWLQNDEACYRYWTSRARGIYEAAREIVPSEDLHRKVVIALASELHDLFQNDMPVETGVYTDLLGWALRYIDWIEVAENLCEEE